MILCLALADWLILIELPDAWIYKSQNQVLSDSSLCVVDDLFATGVCKDMKDRILNMNSGRYLWVYLKPLLAGKILYSPDNEVTRQIVQNANSSFNDFAQLFSVVKSVVNSNEEIKRSLNGSSGVNTLKVSSGAFSHEVLRLLKLCCSVICCCGFFLSLLIAWAYAYLLQRVAQVILNKQHLSALTIMFYHIWIQFCMFSSTDYGLPDELPFHISMMRSTSVWYCHCSKMCLTIIFKYIIVLLYRRFSNSAQPDKTFCESFHLTLWSIVGDSV